MKEPSQAPSSKVASGKSQNPLVEEQLTSEAKAKVSEKAKPAADSSRHAEFETPRDRQLTTANEIERLKKEVKEAKDQYLRTVAEFENTKKRLHREKEEFVKFASEAMVLELLPIVDSLDHALVAVDKQSDAQAVIQGVHLIYRQLLGLLGKEEVKRIPTVGELFDPHRHEAVAQVEAADGTHDGTIVEEVRVGYTMHGKVIRPAMVKVAKKTLANTKESPHSEPQRDNQQNV